MCWSRGLAISRWRSLPDYLSVCLSVWAVRDVSTPIVGSGVEARLVEYGLGRDYARRCAMAGKPSAADTARIRPLPRPTPVRSDSGTAVLGCSGGPAVLAARPAAGAPGCCVVQRRRDGAASAGAALPRRPCTTGRLLMLCPCSCHSPRVPTPRRRRARWRRGDAAAAAARRSASPAHALTGARGAETPAVG